MRKMIKWTVTVISGFLALAASPAMAQTTNVVMKAYFVLTGIKQVNGGVTYVRVTNQDILAALNATGNFNFGSGAQLILVSTDDQLPVVKVRQGDGTTTDVGAYLALVGVDDEVHSANNLVSWAYWTYDFDNGNGTDFRLSGMATLYRGTVTGPGIGTLTRTYNASTRVYGAGGLKGASTIFSGTVYAGFARAEVD